LVLRDSGNEKALVASLVTFGPWIQRGIEMKRALLFAVVSTSLSAAPFLESDPYPSASTPKPTHCGIYLDTGAKVEVAATSDTSGVYCKFDVNSVAVGAHVAKATHILKDPIWGNLESPMSNTVNFTKPGSPSAPSGFGLVAQ
jgi:hypothetical protein